MATSSAGSHGCAADEGTWTQIRAIRNASQLEPGCTYTVTGYSRGCLNNDVRIVLTASDVNAFSLDVEVHTGWDNSAWQGIYDLDLNRVHALRDNLGNEVRGNAGAEVDRFPWGNTRWTRSEITDSVVYADCASTTLTVDRLRVVNAGIVDVRGAAGAIRYSTVPDGARVYLNGATGLTISQLSMSSRARIYGNNSSAVRMLETKMDSEAYWNFIGRDDVRSTYSSFGSTSRTYYTGGTRQWFTYSKISSYAHVRQYNGIIQTYYMSMDSYAEIRNEAGAGTWLIYGAHYDSRGYIRNYNTAQARSYYDHVDSRGEMNYRGTINATTYYNNVTSYGRIIVDGATVVYACRVDSQSILTLTGGNHYRNAVSGYARLTAPFNTRSVIANGSWAQTLTAANTNKMRDYVNNTLI